ncbi:MAG: helix-turn-helix domain-containing protein [Alphaproteobacteria bacterium]
MLTSAPHAERVTPPAHRVPAAASPASRLEICFADAPCRQFKSNTPLFADGDLKAHAYRIDSGVVLVYKILNDGGRQIVTLAFPGDFIGLEAEEAHCYEAQTLSPTRIRSVPTSTLWRRASEDPVLGRDLFGVLSREVAEARTHLLMIGRLSATGRVATFVHSLVQRNARRGFDTSSILLPVRRSDIADYLCLSVETVSRSLTELKAAGAISLRGWRQVRILDAALLEALAEGEDGGGSNGFARVA